MAEPEYVISRKVISRGRKKLSMQVELAYDYMNTLHSQALALLKDVEAQLSENEDRIVAIRPGGYRFTTNELSMGLETPRPSIAEFYGMCFRHKESGKVVATPFVKPMPAIGFVKVVLFEPSLGSPEVRYGVLRDIERLDQSDKGKFEDVVTDVMRYATLRSATKNNDIEEKNWKNSKVSMNVSMRWVGLSRVTTSEDVGRLIVANLSRDLVRDHAIPA